MAVHVGLLILTLSFDESFSLKDKRMVLRSLLERARRELHVSIAETGMQNRIRSAEIAATFVGSDRREIERCKEALLRMFDSSGGSRVDSVTWEWL